MTSRRLLDNSNSAQYPVRPGGLGGREGGIDQNVVAALAAKGTVTRYSATPEYQGSSFIPTAIRIVASDPGEFSIVINIWGEAPARDGGGCPSSPTGGSQGPRSGQDEAPDNRGHSIIRQHDADTVLVRVQAKGGKFLGTDAGYSHAARRELR
jgi:hypothetical protein